MQSRIRASCSLLHGVVRRRKKAAGGRCGYKIEAALASPVFGQKNQIESAMDVVWSAGKKEVASWLPSTRAFSSRADNGFAGSLRARSSISTSRRWSSLPVGGDNRNGGPDFHVFADATEFGAAWRTQAVATRAMLTSRPSWTIRASPFRSARCGHGRDGYGGTGADLVAPPRRQLGRATGRAPRKRGLVRRMSAAALASRIVTRMREDPQGLREPPQAASRARPEGRRPNPSQEPFHLEIAAGRQRSTAILDD